MMRFRYAATIVGLFVCLLAVTFMNVAGAELVVLPDGRGDSAPSRMMRHYLMAQFEASHQQWKTAYERRTTPEQIAAHQTYLRNRFIEAIGGLPERTPLNARVTGEVQRDGFIVEKVIFESMPGVYVTGALFLPRADRLEKPWPAVLVPCGHSANGKGEEKYQKAAALLAINGVAALVFDPIDQGERLQLVDESGKAPLWGTRAHQMFGVGSILLGRNTARFEIWDGMRAIDYLQSRPDIDPTRIGCMGNSGGGTQTAYLMALDDRIVAASPSCFITSFDRLLWTIGGQDAEQNIFGQLAFGMDHADYLTMRAPVPILISAATHDFFDIRGTWDSFRHAKRIYSRLGYSHRIDLIENDSPHGYHRPQREAAARWMLRWLKGEDRPITEPDIKVLTDDEIRCTPRGQVMFLPGARSVYEVNGEYERELAEKRTQYWSSLHHERDREKARHEVRRIVGMRAVGELAKLTIDDLVPVEGPALVTPGGVKLDRYVLKPEPGIVLPVVIASDGRAASRSDRMTALLVHEGGIVAAIKDGLIDRAYNRGTRVVAMDVRGVGDTQQRRAQLYDKAFGADGQDVTIAYLLGRNYVAMRAEDVITCARVFGKADDSSGPVRLIAVGNVGVPALHAGALAPELFDRVTIRNTLHAWADVVHTPITNNQLVTAVHGALRFYDLPDLVRLLGDRVRVESPVGPDGKPWK